MLRRHGKRKEKTTKTGNETERSETEKEVAERGDNFDYFSSVFYIKGTLRLVS